MTDRHRVQPEDVSTVTVEVERPKKTGSHDPEGAGKQVFGPQMNKAEAQLHRVRSSADTSSSERRADSVQKSRSPGQSEAPREKRVQTKGKTCGAVVIGSGGNGARRE